MSPGGDWKVITRDSNISPPIESFSPHDSFEEALTTACELAKVAHQTVLRIEGPDGEMYDQAYISMPSVLAGAINRCPLLAERTSGLANGSARHRL
jgi:hypothetical protein